MFKNGKKVFILGAAAGAIACLVIVFTVLFFSEPPKPVQLPVLADDGPYVQRVSAFDFAMPDELQRFLSPRPVYFREAGTPWTAEDSREFWKDPRELAASVLKRQNRQKLDDILRKAP